jgi:hypothetical protein
LRIPKDPLRILILEDPFDKFILFWVFFFLIL